MRSKGSPSPSPKYSGLPTPLFFVLLCACFLLVCSAFSGEVKAVNASNALNLTDWDTQMSYALGFDDSGFVGGVVLTMILIALLVLPVVLIGRKRDYGEYPLLIMLFIGLVGGVALEWVSYWVLLMCALIVALMFSGKIRGWASGGS